MTVCKEGEGACLTLFLLTTEGQRAEMRGRYTAMDFVIEGLAHARAVDGVGIAAAGKAVVDRDQFGVGGDAMLSRISV